MKKFIIGTLTFGMIAAVGMTDVNAESGQPEMPHEGIDQSKMEEMHDRMMDSEAVINFGQAKNMMEEMHPEMTKEQMKNMYRSMHGTNGAAPSANFKGMHMENR